jgi:hypothetical protein
VPDINSLDETVASVTHLPMAQARAKGKQVGKRQYTFHRQADVRSQIQTSHIVRRLHMHFDGQVELTPTMIACGKILLDRTVPVLSAVEVAHIDPLPSEGDLLAVIRQLIAQNPALLSAIQPLTLPGVAERVEDVPAESGP